MENKKGFGAIGIVIIVIIIVILLGAVFYVYNNFLQNNPKSNLNDLRSDHLDDAFTELEEVDFNVPVS